MLTMLVCFVLTFYFVLLQTTQLGVTSTVTIENLFLIGNSDGNFKEKV